MGADGYYYASWTFNHVDYGVNVMFKDPIEPNWDACAPGTAATRHSAASR